MVAVNFSGSSGSMILNEIVGIFIDASKGVFSVTLRSRGRNKRHRNQVKHYYGFFY
jgi:hypothetical protein